MQLFRPVMLTMKPYLTVSIDTVSIDGLTAPGLRIHGGRWQGHGRLEDAEHVLSPTQSRARAVVEQPYRNAMGHSEFSSLVRPH